VPQRRPLADDLETIALRAQAALGADHALVVPAERGEPLPPGPDAGPTITAPIAVDGDHVGTLVVSRDPGRPPFGESAGLLAAICELAAHAVAATRRADARTEQLALAHAVSDAVAGADWVEGVFMRAAEAIFARTSYSGVTATVVSEATREQVVVADHSRVGPTAPRLRRPVGTGLHGVAIESGRQLSITEAGSDPRYAWPGDTVYESLLITPVVTDGRCIGLIEISDGRPSAFVEGDAELMATVATQIATAVRGARLREESGRRAARLELTAAVARDVASAQTVDGALRAAVEAVHAATDYDAVAAVVADAETGEQVVAIERVRVDATIEGRRRPLGTGAVGDVLRTGRQRVFGEASSDPDYVPWVEPLDVESVLLTPVVDGSPVAVLALYDRACDRFDEADAALMLTVAEQVAAALRGVRLREQSDARATRLALALEVARAVGEADTVEGALRAAATAIRSAIACDAVTAFVPVPGTSDQVVLVDVDDDEHRIEGMRRPIDEGLSGRVFTRGRQVVAATAEAQGEAWRGGVPEYQSALLTPVAYDGRVAAIIGLHDRAEARYDEDDALLMRTVCEHVAVALRLLEVRDQSEVRAARLAALERRQRELLGRLLQAQEEERSRVAADLHDDTIQVMAACVLALDSVRLAIDRGAHDRAAAALRDVAGLISGAVERTRRMTFDLRPAVLWHQGLVAAVRQSLGALEREASVATTLTVASLDGRVDATAEAIVFRSITEALANVRAHAAASSVTVHLERTDAGLVAEVADDGRGFELEPTLRRARRTNHLGLESMMERTAAAGGEVRITTAPGEGTRVRIRVPLPG
jgi:signal transduction histidine kinase